MKNTWKLRAGFHSVPALTSSEAGHASINIMYIPGNSLLFHAPQLLGSWRLGVFGRVVDHRRCVGISPGSAPGIGRSRFVLAWACRCRGDSARGDRRAHAPERRWSRAPCGDDDDDVVHRVLGQKSAAGTDRYCYLRGLLRTYVRTHTRYRPGRSGRSHALSPAGA